MSINEGQTIQYTVVTSKVTDGTTLYWKTTGNTTNSDIVGGNTGSITVTNNQAIFNVTVLNDVTTDGTKTLGISLSTGSQNGPTVVSTANPITVNDTSLAPINRMWSWGSNNFGQLGLNNQVNRSSPVQVGTDITWSSINRGIYNSFGIKADKTLWGWGRNIYGSVGFNDRAYRSSPTQVGAETNWSGISGNGTVTIATKTDGTLWSWGMGYYGSSAQNDQGAQRRKRQENCTRRQPVIT